MALFSDYQADLMDMPEYRVRRYSDVKFSVPHDRVAHWLDLFHRGQPVHVTLPAWCGMAFVKEVMVRNPIGFLPPDADVTVVPTGAPDARYSVPYIKTSVDFGKNDFCVNIAAEVADKMLRNMQRKLDRMIITGKEESVADKKLDTAKLKANRFYVGSRLALEERLRGLSEGFDPTDSKMTRRSWGHAKVQDAVAHAERLLESKDGEEQFIVKIIKVVRRKPTPVIVEDIK